MPEARRGPQLGLRIGADAAAGGRVKGRDVSDTHRQLKECPCYRTSSEALLMGWRRRSASTDSLPCPPPPPTPAARVDPRRLAALRKRGRPAARLARARTSGAARDAGRSQSLGRCADRPRLPVRRAAALAGPSRASRCSSTASPTATRRNIRAPPTALRARFMTASEGEFLGLSSAEAAARIADGRTLIEGVIGRPIDGFVAPAWLYGEGAREALSAIRDPARRGSSARLVAGDRRGARLGPVITWASRTRMRLAVVAGGGGRASSCAARRCFGSACIRPTSAIRLWSEHHRDVPAAGRNRATGALTATFLTRACAR